MNSFPLIQPLEKFFSELKSGSEQICADRKTLLNDLAELILRRLNLQGFAQITFICTHNSRRSHLAQILAQTAACYFGIARVTCFSGGTEATACNPRTVQALRRAGFSVVDSTGGSNPRYWVQFSDEQRPLEAWSKVYDQDGNPSEKFIAVMTCSHADQNCPLAPGAADRFSLTYVDPKSSDDSPAEAETYDRRLREIGSEMFYLMSVIERRMKSVSL
jgi:arsenate reductase (thioredoxin)